MRAVNREGCPAPAPPTAGRTPRPGRAPLNFEFQEPNFLLISPVGSGLIGLNSNEWSGAVLSGVEMGNPDLLGLDDSLKRGKLGVKKGEISMNRIQRFLFVAFLTVAMLPLYMSADAAPAAGAMRSWTNARTSGL